MILRVVPRRQNIKIVRLPENVESGHPTEFVEKFIPNLLGAEDFPGGINVDRVQISIFLDFTAEVLSQRWLFDGVKKKLKEVGLRFGMLFTACLIVTQGTNKKIFGLVSEAEVFVNTITEQNPS